ncbi:hypothetical protein I4U23_008046 [Adineta vaga]|nr:hypothetical protein I4U23_008046 [Adineta vaga]
MHHSLNKLEDFSLEIFLEIFDYLSITDRFNAFFNLSTKINSALNLSGLSADLTNISRQTYDHFYQNIIFKQYSRRIRKLKLSNDLTLGLMETVFNQINLHDFKQLRSLTLIKPSYMTLGSLALSIPYLTQLEHLSIDSNSYPHNFFQLITTTSTQLKSCYLPGLEIQDKILFQSNILIYLTVTVENIGLLLNLLAVFSHLIYLHVTVRSTLYIEDDNLPKLNIVPCEYLRTLKFRILERSSIDFNEIEYFFQHTIFSQLQTFSYTCTTQSLDHLDATRWNEILSIYLSSINKWNFFVQIPYNSYSYMNMKQIIDNIQANLCYLFPLSLSINYLYYIIHTKIYPKRYFDLSLKSSHSDENFSHDPINCDSMTEYSKVNSLIVDINSLSTCTTLPKTIQYLHLQGNNDNLVLSKCLKYCSNQLISLKISGLSNDLPCLPNLRQLTIQHVMFNVNMISKLHLLCPHLELLTIEIDSIKQFCEFFDHLRYKSQLNELKYLRIFSRDRNHTWTSWLNEGKELFYDDNIIYETKNLFLFIWL